VGRGSVNWRGVRIREDLGEKGGLLWPREGKDAMTEGGRWGKQEGGDLPLERGRG